MAYTQTQWQTGDPITQSRLMKIEDGIAAASATADDALKPTDSQFKSVETKVTALQTIVGETNDKGLRRQVTDLSTRVDQAAGDNSPGVKAFNQIIAATTSHDPTYDNLDSRFYKIERYTTQIENATATMNNEIIHTNNKTYSSLNLRLNEDEQFANQLQTEITNARTYTNSSSETSTYNNLASRLNHTDQLVDLLNANYNADTGRITTIENSLKAALESTALNRTTATNNAFLSIDARMETSEQEIVDARGDEANLNARLNKINTELDNAHESISLGKTGNNKYSSIDARFEAIEGELVGTTAMSSRLDSLTDSIGTINSNISDLDTAYKAADSTLTNRINSLDTAYKAADTAITDSITELTSTVSDMDTAYKAADSALADDIADLETADGAMATRIDGVESAYQAADSALSTRITTAQNGVNALQNTVNDPTTGLAATKAIADAAATDTDLDALADRVTTLENNPQSTTTIIENVNYNNDGIPTNISNPSTDIDYILKKDDKYYYWKYINNNWELISGGGGSGTSSAEFYAALTDVNEPSETVDYFIGSGINYIHYRRYNNQWVQILPAGLINSVTVDTSAVTEEENSPTKSRPIIKALGSDTNLLADFTAIKSITATPVNGGDDGYVLSWTDIDGNLTDVTLSGGGAAAAGTAVITRITDGNLVKIVGEDCILEFTYVAKDSSDQIIAQTTTATWYINRARVATSDITINDPTIPTSKNSFNITPYLQTGVNNISVSISIIIDGQTLTRTQTWIVDVKNFSLTWEYDESTINDQEEIIFSCVPYGVDITKTLHLKVGSHEQTQTVTTSGIPTSVTLTNNFTHGNYTAEMWMTATINGVSKETDHISHDFIVAEIGNTNPIIAATLPSSNVDQYNTISIPFVVYTPNANTSHVELAVDGVVVDTRDVGRTTQTWNYTPLTSGTKVLTITSGEVVKTLNLIVDGIDINNTEIPNYTFKLKASELASNNALKAWYYDSNNQNTTKLQFSNNFDWVNGGIKTEQDENGQLRQFIRVKSGTTMTIPYQMFLTDPRTNGMNFKIIFKIENCRDYDAVVATNMAEDIGIQLSAHGASFKSSTTTISTQYGEEEYTELEFEVYKATLPNGSDAPNQYIMAWIDGVITTARKYGGNFVQTAANAANLVIGSTNCDVCIYLVKYYPFVLSRNDHVTNFIADAPNAVEMIQRYNRNDILDEDEDIDYNKLANKNKDCRVWLYDIERMTKAKDDAINVNRFQQIWENGDQYYQLEGTNAKLKIQGTSSFNYRYGAANTDIDFGKKKAPNATLVDGYGNNLLADELEYKGFKINDDSLPITYSNTKVNFASCEQVNNMCNAEWYQRYQPFPSLSARDCMEFAMGVQFIKDRRENEPSDGITLFTEKGASFNPEKYYMYSIANMGTSKKNTHIFHSEDECCIEIKENTSDAQKMKSYDSTWTANDENTQNYEMRYPDLKPTKVTTDIKDGWERFVTWMVASNPNAATGNVLLEPVTFEPYTFRGHNREVVETEGRHFAQVLRGTTVSQYAGTYTNDTFEYRMAKMLSECEDYMAMDSVIYHFCFIERHTMVDNVAKNTFWSSRKEVGGPSDTEGYWIWDLSKNYDNDTANGNNNNGLLVFDYGNEAGDTRDGTPVFNGHDAVWFIFASNLYEACRTMFTNRETIGAWNSVAYHNYLTTEQHKVPERVWNECYWYDYLRTYENNVETTWINFLDGGQKIHQRKHFEDYEEIYDSSKYRGSLSHNQSITLRGEAIDYQTLNLPAQESKFTITMFNKCYLTIWIGTNFQTVKCQKGVPVTLYFYEDNDPSKGYMSLANSVIDIDSGSMVQAIGDLSLIYPSSGQFGNAKRLRSLQIGSDVEGYYNPNMNNNSVLTFNNKMLEYLYVQNLPQATYNLDLSNCPELKVLNATGSGFTGFVFANGGLLNTASVNAPSSLVMRNLNNLTKANFTLAVPTAVTSLRLENCSLFDNYTFINELTNLNTLRLTNIDWSLNTNTLLDNLVELMGIDEAGMTISQSYLSGNVSLLGVVYEGDYNKYNDAWSPDLTIDVSHASQFVQQHLVIYKNEDGTELYRQYINHGNNLIDPYYNNLISVPEKAPDIESRYTFGELDFAANYKQYSGWRLSTDAQSIIKTYGENPVIPVNGALEVYAVYSTVAQQYTVRWLLRDNTVVASTPSPQNYGGGYDLSAPTIKDVQNAGFSTYTFSSNGDYCSYSIMTGWEKLPTNITPTVVGSTYDIYATWLTRSNVNYNTVLTSDAYSAEEKLLILKEMAAARNSLHLADIFPVTLGYEGVKPGITLVSAPTRYTGTATVVDTYEPFSANTSFTMMIDYRFEHKTSTLANEAILLSCYDESGDSAQGFKLFYDPQSGAPVPQISFGSTDSQSATNIQTIGSTINNRGVVVLRHIAGDPILYVYTGSTASGLNTNYSSGEFRKAINWSAMSNNAKIVLGGTNITGNASLMNATGTLYKVKYWEEDLGDGECTQLANWCHENINFAVQDWNGYGQHSALNSTLTASLVLHTMNASEMGTITEDTMMPPGSTIGWDPSTVRSFYNNRLYQALPTTLQSIIVPATIAHRKANYNNSQYVIGTGSTTTTDYVFAPSCVELGATGTNLSSHSIEATAAFAWYNSNQMKVLHYNNGVFEQNASYNRAEYTNLRFPYRYNPVNMSVTIYTDYPSTGSSFYAWTTSHAIELKTGDILIPSDSEIAYVYVGPDEIGKGAPYTTSTESFLENTSGGWIPSIRWWTRSVPQSISPTTNSCRFIVAAQDGELAQGNVRYNNGLVYSIAL